MMLISFLNFFAALAILIYPAAILAGIMAFDAPTSGSSPTAWIISGSSLLYPIFVIFCIWYSRSHNSTIVAIAGTIPTIAIALLLGPSLLKPVSNFYSLKRDFSCSRDAFVSIENQEGNFSQVKYWYRKWYINHDYRVLGRIDHRLLENNKEVLLVMHREDPMNEILKNCRNSEGKSLEDIYEIQVKDIRMKRNKTK